MSKARDIADRTFNTDATFGDNDKATFGDAVGGDLQIYHDNVTNNSVINESGTGDLQLWGNDIRLMSADGTETLLRGNPDAQIQLYYNNAVKLATTATGVDVTGTVTVNGGGTNFPITVTSTDQYAGITFVDNTTTSSAVVAIYADGNELGFEAGNAERLRIDSGGAVIVDKELEAGNLTDTLAHSFNSLNGSVAYFTSGGTGGGGISLSDANSTGANYNRIRGEGDELTFDTNNTEAMRIDSSGNLLVGKTSSSLDTTGHQLASTGYAFHTRSNGTVLYINRQTSDGGLVNFYHDNNVEGSITVSGTTVSYNGGHLARWSQLTDSTKDTSIVKGTVMTNLDQMAVWHHEAVAATYYVEGDELPEITPATYYTEDDTLPEGVSVGDEKTAAVYAQVGDEKTPAADAYTEDNEQLNCMAVSSVEGDPNVAGVFVNWDNDDDEFNDMNTAMTGDMVIRIAQGTTVARGDLLMSAGDGTAKPQGDDIVRSKTIAKVTSTHVSHTYDDGSYLVPCVLMAC